ncbi:cysteine hydrolase family protein [uncultured Aeromicrobium sp.]|uniref:cysteine hydrolase family protein n=1 Tax=uncultured Aeromicrobium sp. TaxID=337820 RepID=UPI0025E1C6F5|nr:isochorismatase family cysteine hydrolase [uncultured Aeromicrobium sp.]
MSVRQQWARSADHVNLHPVHAAPRPVTLAAQPQHVTLDLERTALLVVDMQNDFCHPDGWLGSIGVDVAGARAAIEPCAQLTTAARAAGVPVTWVNWGNRPDLANLPAGVIHVYDADGTGGGIGDRAGRSEAVLTAGSWGARVVDELAVAPVDLTVTKYRMSGFTDTDLDSILRLNGIDTLLFAGVNADQCVLATLMDAAALGYNVLLVEGAATTTSPDFCLQATVYNTRQCFGFTVDWSDLVSVLRDAA